MAISTSTLRSPYNMPDLPSLPDDVIEKIVPLLPTKGTVQASFLSEQWRVVVSSCPVLNFNEEDHCYSHNLNCYIPFLEGCLNYRWKNYQKEIMDHVRHIRFINFLEGYLDYRRKNCHKDLMDKLSLHMTMYSPPDSSTITKWLEYACQRALKELDISLKSYYIIYKDLYRLPWVVFTTAKSLTTLKLECVILPDIQEVSNHEPLFPSLKTLSIKITQFSDDRELHHLLLVCPSLEYLSLTDCSFIERKCYICCPSLKFLEVKSCLLDVIRVDQAFNLESFTFVAVTSELPTLLGRRLRGECDCMILNNAFNLKYINISVDYLRGFSLLGGHSALEATNFARNVEKFVLFDGCLNSKLSVKADEATVLVRELFDQQWLSSCSTILDRLMCFLRRLTCCKRINLYSHDVQSLIVPKNYREEVIFGPLPKTSTLKVWMPNAPVAESRDYLELKNSLQWIAPSASISINRVDVEAERKKVNQLARQAINE